jgi:hypothetical protein
VPSIVVGYGRVSVEPAEPRAMGCPVTTSTPSARSLGKRHVDKGVTLLAHRQPIVTVGPANRTFQSKGRPVVIRKDNATIRRVPGVT